LLLNGGVSASAYPGQFIVQSDPETTFSSFPSGAYSFAFSESTTLTGLYELLGGTGAAYIETDISDRNFVHTGGNEVNGNATISGGIYDSNVNVCYPGMCHVLFGPFLFGQPFQETLTATAFANFPVLEGTNNEQFFAYSTIDVVGIVDSSGNPIPGASLVEVVTPEPASWLLMLSGVVLVLNIRLLISWRVRGRQSS
jgi:hypothetical protein